MEALSFAPLDVLRVLCGVWFLPHCIGKIRNLGPASQTFAKAGLHPARAFVVLTTLVEVLAGLGLAFNIYPKSLPVSPRPCSREPAMRC